MTTACARLADGEPVTLRPSGRSMVPLIHDRQQVVIAPCDPAALEIGDIVLARVAGNILLHLVTGVDPAARRIQIGNNLGKINGWVGYGDVAGICVTVDGAPRPDTAGKVTGASGSVG